MSVRSLLTIAAFVAIFLAVVWGMRKAMGSAGDSLLKVLKRGALLEFTSRPGALSFMTFLVICFMGLTLVASSDLLALVYTVFNVPAGDQRFTGEEAMGFALCVVALNFITVAWMQGQRRRK